MSLELNNLLEFGDFRLDPNQRLLLRDGRPVNLTPKAFELLVLLAARTGKLVEKEELLNTIWPDVAVEEGNLAVMISHIRKALGDDPERHQFIETVPKYGYRFVANVTRSVEPATEPVPSIPVEAVPSLAASGQSGNGRTFQFRFSIMSTLAIGLLMVCAVAVAWRLSARRPPTVVEADTIHSLAILPFRQIGQAGDEEYLAEGTADALITRLGGINDIVVRPASAVEEYRNSALNPVDIGKRQGVDAVLDGRMQRVGERVRLTVHLIRVQDGTALWADAFDERVTDILDLEDEISERVAQSLRLHLSNADVQRIRRKPTDNAEAYEAYLKGRYFWNKRTEQSMQRGLEFFQESIRLDPGFAEGYEGIADSFATLGLYGSMPPNGAFPKARDAAQKALSMNDTLADAHATLGLIYFYYDWDGPAAENEFRRAIDLNPHYAMAHSWSGEALAAMGRFPEAIEESRRAISDDPLSLIVNANAGWTLFLAGRSDEAIQVLRKAIELDPTFPRTHFRLGIILEATNHSQEAIDEFRKAVELSKGNADYEASLANAYASAGRPVEAREVLNLLLSRSRSEYVPAFGFALIYSALKERDSAFEWLHRATSDHSTSMAYAQVDPLIAPLRSDGRFSSVAQNLKF